jgi:hypothetical protein
VQLRYFILLLTDYSTSPSIYFAIETMAAADLCSEVGSPVTSGTTLSFPTDVLSTVPAYPWGKAAYPSFSGYPSRKVFADRFISYPAPISSKAFMAMVVSLAGQAPSAPQAR